MGFDLPEPGGLKKGLRLGKAYPFIEREAFLKTGIGAEKAQRDHAPVAEHPPEDLERQVMDPFPRGVHPHPVGYNQGSCRFQDPSPFLEGLSRIGQGPQEVPRHHHIKGAVPEQEVFSILQLKVDIAEKGLHGSTALFAECWMR